LFSRRQCGTFRHTLIFFIHLFFIHPFCGGLVKRSQFWVAVVASAIRLLCPEALEAQWGTPTSMPFPLGHGAYVISAVDTSVVWCNALNVSGGNSDWFARTTDGGSTWQAGKISGAGTLDNGSITAVGSLTAWATKSDRTRTTSSGVFKTSDGGMTWFRQATAFDGAGGNPMFIHFWNADTGLVVGERNKSSWEIYTTSNGGSTWLPVPLANIPPIAGDTLTEAFEYNVLGHSFWFCTSTGRVFRSTNQGETWTAAVVGPGYGRVHSVAFQDQNTGLATSFVGGNPTTVKTTDGGDTWFAITPPTVPTPHIMVHVPGTSGVYVVTGHDWPGGVVGSAFTADAGSNWTTIDGRGYGPLRFIAPNVGWVAAGAYPLGTQGTMQKWIGTALYAGLHSSSPAINFGNVLVSKADTMVIQVSNAGLRPLYLHTIANKHPEYALLNLPSFPAAIQPGGSLAFNVSFRPVRQGVVNDTVFIGSDDTLHPVLKVGLGGKGISAISPARAGVLYTTSQGTPEGYLLSMSTEDGAIDTIGALGVPEIQGMSIRHSDKVIYGSYATATSTTFYTIAGVSGDAVRARVIPLGNLRAIAFSPGDTLYGATSKGSLYRIDLATGQADSLGTSQGLTYSGLSFRPGRNQLWASVRTPLDNIFTINTTTGAATFVGLTGFSAPTLSLAFDPRGGLFALIDNGSGEGYLASVDTISASGAIVAGPLSVSNLQAIATRTDSLGTVPVREPYDGNLPLAYELRQNFPNPFNPTTTITYALPVDANVSLTIYDIIGQKVIQLLNGRAAAGYHDLRFDASNLASGIYFYRLQAGDFVQTRKLLVLR
jgi:photosystem II stability/assembly factor-like uncharacterized protein